MIVLLIVVLTLPILYVALQWNELIHNVSPISSKVGSCGTVAERSSTLESRFVAAPCTPGDGRVVFYLDSVGKSTTCDGVDLYPMTGRSASRFYKAERTACLAPLLSQGSCYEPLTPGYHSLNLERGRCGVDSYARVDQVLRGTTDRSRCNAAGFTLSYTKPTPVVYCVADIDRTGARSLLRPRPTTIPT